MFAVIYLSLYNTNAVSFESDYKTIFYAYLCYYHYSIEYKINAPITKKCNFCTKFIFFNLQQYPLN